jgi:hypothetical protein
MEKLILYFNSAWTVAFKKPLTAGWMTAFVFTNVACTPTIKIETPSQPIEINLNVKIEHEIRIRVEKDLEELFEEESDIF